MAKKDDLKLATSEDAKRRKIDYKDWDENMTSISFRIPESDRVALEKYFASRRLKLSQGLRMVVADYMNREQIK